jgi:putative membrane protein
MYTARHFPLAAALFWTKEVLILAPLWAVAIVLAYEVGEQRWIGLPALPVSILGTAVSFYLGFKGNAAYGRLWEARQIWGGIVNTSRAFAVHVRDLVRALPGEEAEGVRAVHREVVYRHLAWLNALRTVLRRKRSWEHNLAFNDHYRGVFGTLDNGPEVLARRLAPYLAEPELGWVMARQNQPTQLLGQQSRQISALREAGRFDEFTHLALMRLVETLYEHQGKCERLKNFPLPRQYTTANHWFVLIFIAVVPLALVPAFAGQSGGQVWMVVPVSLMISWVFYLWDVVLDFSENPFEGLINDIPMDGMCRGIEIDLRELLGETELPSALPPAAPDVAM